MVVTPITHVELQHNVFVQAHREVQKHASYEIALALGTNRPNVSHTAYIDHIQRFTQADTRTDSVQFSTHDIHNAHHIFSQQWWHYIGDSHDHLRNLWHAHDRSDADYTAQKKLLAHDATKVHILWYRGEGYTDVKATNAYGQDITVGVRGVVGRWQADILRIFDDKRVEIVW